LGLWNKGDSHLKDDCHLACAQEARHDKMVSLVERMLSLHKAGDRHLGRTPQEQEMVKREIESTDRAIDRLVYELYGLSEEEIGIVES